MKICLISAPTANQFDGRAVGESDAARIMGELAPVGILSLAAVLEARGLQPEVVETRLISAILPDSTWPAEILKASTSTVSVRYAAAIRSRCASLKK
jgi:hypothetical protein